MPDERDVGRAEPSLLDRSREGAESTLGRGFMAVMSKLDPTVSVPTGALRRQQAADAMRSLLTGGSRRTGDGKVVRFRDDELSTVGELMLFTIDWEGLLQHRGFCRRIETGPHGRLVDPWFEEIELA